MPYKREKKLQQNWIGVLFSTPALVVMLALVVYPMLYGIFISFFDTNLVSKFEFVGLKY